MILLKCYPTFYDVFNDFFGWNICVFKVFHSFGFFVALGFITALWLLRIELKRRERLGYILPAKAKILAPTSIPYIDLLWTTGLGFIIGLKLPGIIFNDPLLCQSPKDFLFSFYGNNLTAGIVAAFLTILEYFNMKRRFAEAPKSEVIVDLFPSQRVGAILTIAVISGIGGAKLFYFFEKPSALVNIFNQSFEDFFSGLTIYGGLICAAISILVYAKWKKIPIGHLFDSLAPAFFIAYAIGRLGCHTAGDGDWGIVNNMPKPEWIPQFLWSNYYENNIINECNPYVGVAAEKFTCSWNQLHRLAEPVFPTALYETIMVSILTYILWIIRKPLSSKPGLLVSIFFIFDGIERFLIESIRVNPREFLGNRLTQAELIALIFILLGVSLSGYLLFYYKKKQVP